MPLDYEPRRDLLMAFSTPIAQMRLAEGESINPGLAAAILAKEAASPGQTRSNVGGWHSGDDLFDWPEPEFATLKAGCEDAVRHMMSAVAQGKPFDCGVTAKAWANVSRRGAYNQPHTHAKNHWSGVYYVTVGRPDEGWKKNGMIELQDPRERSEMAGMPLNPFGRTITVPAKPGMLVLFPSWLIHWVNPFYGEDHRISIAFNATVNDFKLRT